MSDPHDYIRQTPEIKEHARALNKIKEEIRNLQVSSSWQSRLTDTRYNPSSKPASFASGSDNAIHDNVPSEIQGVLDNVTPAAADEFLIEDASDSNNKKAVLFSALEGALNHDSLAGFVAAEHYDLSDGSADLDVNDVTLDQLTIDNQGAGSNPVLSSNSSQTILDISSIRLSGNIILSGNAIGNNSPVLTFGTSAQGEWSKFDGDIEVDGDLNHDGSNVGFYGTSPASQSSAYSITNVSTDRDYDASGPPTNQVLADVLGTLIADIKATGLIG